jgi:chemotaxis methyl-accepting protein methylase
VLGGPFIGHSIDPDHQDCNPLLIGNTLRYLDVLRSDPIELGHLAEDLLINVTRFFRDAKVFDYLAAKIVPDLVRNHSFDADCSDGCEH